MKKCAYIKGKDFGTFDAHLVQERGKWFAYVDVGEGGYYETDRYKEKTNAMSELKGYLEGLMVQMKKYVEYIDNELKKGE